MAKQNVRFIDQLKLGQYKGRDGDFVKNNEDIYTGTNKVEQVVTLTQSEYDAIPTKNAFTLYIIPSGSADPIAYMDKNDYDPNNIARDAFDMSNMVLERITDYNVNGSYNFNRNSGSLWELTMTAETTFTDSELAQGTNSEEIKVILSGSFTRNWPSYWDVVGDTYNGAIRNLLTVLTVNGNGGSEDVICVVKNLL